MLLTIFSLLNIDQISITSHKNSEKPASPDSALFHDQTSCVDLPLTKFTPENNQLQIDTQIQAYGKTIHRANVLTQIACVRC